jgi:putative oxidoreductase
MVNLTKTKNDKWIILIRILVGFVFLSECIQKFIFPEIRDTGRFGDIGMKAPEFFGYFVGSVETVCGFLVLTGTYIRLAVIPLITIMISAIFLTKIPILQNRGFWAMAHAARTDLSMLLCSIFLLAQGSGRFSTDLGFFRK